MEARHRQAAALDSGAPVWLLRAIPLALIALTIAVFTLLGGPASVIAAATPVEELTIEQVVLHPGGSS